MSKVLIISVITTEKLEIKFNEIESHAFQSQFELYTYKTKWGEQCCVLSKYRIKLYAYLVALYNGHHGQAQHNSKIRIANATRSAKQISNQNSTRFSAL